MKNTFKEMNLKVPILYNFLKSPLTVFLSILSAVFFGIYFPEQSLILSNVGKIYIALIQLAVIPILATSVILAISRLSTHVFEVSLKKTMVIYIGFLICVSFFGIGFSEYLGLGYQKEQIIEMNTLIAKNVQTHDLEIRSADLIQTQINAKLLNFIIEIFPSNIIVAFSTGYILQILMFSILFGMALGHIKDKQRLLLSNFIDSTNALFNKIIEGLVLFLPLGTFCIVSGQTSILDGQSLRAFEKFIIFCVLGLCLLIFVATLIIWRFSAKNYREVLKALRDSSLIAFITGSSIASIPLLMEALTDRLNFNKNKIGLFVPIGIATCRHGEIFYYSLSTMFIAQLYHVSLQAGDYVIILFGSILAGLASVSVGMLNLTNMVFILKPLGLPVDIIIVLFLAIDNLIIPLRTVTSVLLNGASAVLVARSKP